MIMIINGFNRIHNNKLFKRYFDKIQIRVDCLFVSNAVLYHVRIPCITIRLILIVLIFCHSH